MKIFLQRIAVGLLLANTGMPGASAQKPADIDRAEQLAREGNYAEAYTAFREIALQASSKDGDVARAFSSAIGCLQNLNRQNEFDSFAEAVATIHAESARVIAEVAGQYANTPWHYGFLIGGEFQRGRHRGGGRRVDMFERDRVRALQLFVSVLPRVSQELPSPEAYVFYRSFAAAVMSSRGRGDTWRLQVLTDLSVLPEPGEADGYGGGTAGAPVDGNGQPVFYRVPATFETACSDGERWRWLLREAERVAPDREDEVKLDFARFLRGQFGVQTLQDWGGLDSDGKTERSGIFAVQTLSDDETIARLAVGVKRFALPEEFRYIQILKSIAGRSINTTNVRGSTISILAEIYENRRQYETAVSWWERYVPFDAAAARQHIGQITGNWGSFEPVSVQPADRSATVDLTFRNAEKAFFTAQPVDVEQLLSDVQKYIEGKPATLEWQKISVDNLGWRLVQENQAKYLGKRVAEWALPLEPKPGHFDRTVTVTTPLRNPGTYFLICNLEKGNTSRIVMSLADTAIVRKQLDRAILYFLADARTGQPIPAATLDFFGFRQEWIQGTRRYRIETRRLTATTDGKGQCILAPEQLPENFRWLVTAKTPDGRFACHGFSGLGFPRFYDREYNQAKGFIMTDRPVYRPGQKVSFKAWVRHAKYDLENVSLFAGREISVTLQNPKGDAILEKSLTADTYGGIAGEYPLGSDADLGVYRLSVAVDGRNLGGQAFRVEEYKKPEFEVIVETPEETVRLGDTVPVGILAKYYFGAPVTDAEVKVKILRYAHTARWYPSMPWDWLYGSGYWWFPYDYDWYPGWRKWGCERPGCWWLPSPQTPPEVVVETEGHIGPDGRFSVELDTRPALELHGDQDHRYEISVEVRDRSRRTIVGKGDVLVARDPFRVYAWTDRGYYRVGETVRASFQARTLAGKAVQGKGRLRLLRVVYGENMEPEESEVEAWDLDPDAAGTAQQKLNAARPGQYRISLTVTDAKGRSMEGGYLFSVIGEGTAQTDYRFNAIELVPDNTAYSPGDTVRLMINTAQPDSTVLLFVRPANGICLPPETLTLKGKSQVYEIPVLKRDMPNFFVEALTVCEGKTHVTVREIAVPPSKRVLNVEVLPSKERFAPGEEGKLRIRLTDMSGKPFRGTTVVAVYDKSVEYISGGSNVPAIRPFFWDWRRHHREEVYDTLSFNFSNQLKEGEEAMSPIGVFGRSVFPGGFRGVMEGAMGGMKHRGMMMAKSAEEDAADGLMAAAPMMAAAPEESAMGAMPDNESSGGEPGQEPILRRNFADTALWIATLDTDDEGIAEAKLPMPESLTTWQIRVWAMGHGTRVGEGHTEVITSKNVIIRLQAPRFFLEKDEVVLSANIHNYLDAALDGRAVIETEGDCLQVLDRSIQTVSVPAGGEIRVDWRVKVVREGEAIIRMKALAAAESDAMEMRFPVYVHGMDRMVSFSGALRPDERNGTITIDVPGERRPETSRLEVRYSPTLAMAMIDALPYLTAYPYGCTEQTLNRFLPTVITRNVLSRMGVSLEDIREKTTNLNAQELGDARERAAQWQRGGDNPVFDGAEVARRARKGVEDLTNMQLSDGGWGWFSGWGEHSSPHTTATVVHGLQAAVANDVSVDPDVIQRGLVWLQTYQEGEIRKLVNAEKEPHGEPWKSSADNLDACVFRVLADAGTINETMLDYLYRDRTHLSVYGKALYGLGLLRTDEKEKLAMVMRNIVQYVRQDNENQTAWLNLGNEDYWWNWYGSEIEAHAAYLKLLSAVAPSEPLAPRLVKYLLNNRKHATYWNSTRDTALCVEAFADYLAASGEEQPDLTVRVRYDGRVQREIRITRDNLFTYDPAVVLSGKAVETGKHIIDIEKTGTGSLYYTAYFSTFTLQDFIPRAGLEVKVQRQVYRLVPETAAVWTPGAHGQAIAQKSGKYRREALADGDSVRSGDLLEVELLVESKNDYEYIILDDMKIAGCEPVDLRSGYTGNDLGAYVEFRDERVAFFAARLARGRHSVSYRMRAEIPGRFSALPTRISAMYAPELRGNSDEFRIEIDD